MGRLSYPAVETVSLGPSGLKEFCRDILDVRIPTEKEIWLVSGDVVAMYPNIPIEDGICIVANMLGGSQSRFPQ
jgi:hypothetical protein